MQIAQGWRAKPEAELAVRARIGIRHAQYVLSGKRGLSGDALAALLATDAGPAIFRELSPGIPEAVLASYAREIEVARVKAQRSALDKKLKELGEDA